MNIPATPVRAQLPLYAEPSKFIAQPYGRSEFVLELFNTPLEEVFKPEFFQNVCNRPDFRPGGVIHVNSESPSFYAELKIREVNQTARIATVVLLRKVDLPDTYAEVADGLAEGHSIRWLGSLSQWAVMRDAQVLKSGFENKGDAITFSRDLGRRAP